MLRIVHEKHERHEKIEGRMFRSLRCAAFYLDDGLYLLFLYRAFFVLFVPFVDYAFFIRCRRNIS